MASSDSTGECSYVIFSALQKFLLDRIDLQFETIQRTTKQENIKESNGEKKSMDKT